MILTAVGCAAVLAGSALALDNQSFDLENFNSIDAGGGFSLVVSVGEEQSVRFEGDGADFDEMEIEVRGSELRLDQDRGLFSRQNHLDVTVYVTMPALESLDFSRGIEADVSGLNSAHLDLDVSTGAEVDLSGQCQNMSLDMSTGAILDARELVCSEVDADASTGAEARIHASEGIDASASMGAMIRVYGSPAQTHVSSSMGGSVRIDRTG